MEIEMENFFIFNGTVPVNWFSKIQEDSILSNFYRISPVFYSIAGLCVLIFNTSLKKHDEYFPWPIFGILLIIQGLFSYMGDVENWGEKSYWGTIDVYLASTLTFIGGPLLILRSVMGYSKYPKSFTFIWSCCVLFALYSKLMAKDSITQNNIEDYLLWHSLWHCLPVYATILITLLSFGLLK